MHVIENALIGFEGFILKVVASDLFETALIAGVTAALGAYFGARGAQKFAEEVREKDELIKEIRATNAAISLAYASFNVHFGLKVQLLAKIKDDFERETRRFLEFEARVKAGDPTATGLTTKVELQTIDPFPSPIEQLREVVLDQLSLTGRPINLVTVLHQSAHSLNQTLANRRDFIAKFKATRFANARSQTLVYLGLPDNDGSGDGTHKNLIDSLCVQNDCCIMFSKMLADDLMEYGASLKERVTSRRGGPPPNITKVDLSVVTHPELMPDPKDFEDWETHFEKW